MPWRGIIGLDISPEFARLAQENASNLRGRRTEVTIVQTDATQFVVPDEVTIVFLYNPFRGDPMRQTLSRVLESVDREPRRVAFSTAILTTINCSWRWVAFDQRTVSGSGGGRGKNGPAV